MADESHYASGPDAVTNKRKYEDQTTPPPPRRATGFSAPITSQSPGSGDAPPSYNTAPPPVDDFQLAKQRAQEIAARLINNAEAKRPRVENGGSGFDSNDNVGQKPHISNLSPSAAPVSYGYQGTSKKIDIPNGRVGVIIGKAGETIKYLQLQSGAKIQVTRDMDADPNSPTRTVELMGTPDQIAKAEQLIRDVLAEAESGGSGTVSRRLTGQQPGAEQFVMKIPNNKVGLVIGKGGETIKNMQARSGARIQVIPLHLPPGDTSTERTVQIDGTSEQIEAAKQLVNEVTSENRSRTGGYTQQGYQARPPTNWAPPGPPMQQHGYGYMQSAPAPQYNMPQQPYTGYPQQTSGGYAPGWDQTAGGTNQQTSQGGSYDYYSQQQQPPGGTTGTTDNPNYNYGQPPASGYNQQGQGYPQDGYGGYNAPAANTGYGQPQPNPVQGYDQQQGYTSSTPGYGNVTNPPPEGHTLSSYGGAQGDTSQAAPQPSPGPNPNPAGYAHQGSAQPGYGVPPSQPGYGTQPPSGYGYGPPHSQKPPASQSAYGQPQQSPTAQGGYVQPGYPHSQPPAAYTQPDSAAQRAPPSSFGTAPVQTGYGAAPYGTPPAAQPGYGQQPPPYSSAYGGGYSQPPAYDAAPTSQAVQPNGVAKASPQS